MWSRALGMLNDDPDLLRRAEVYLRNKGYLEHDD